MKTGRVDSDERMIVNGLTFRVRRSAAALDEGSATYVLVHGIGTSHRYFQRLHDELARSAVVYSIDIPGFGGLPKPVRAPDIAEVAAALGEVLDSLQARDVVLVGHSMGTQWTVETGVLRPDLVSAVVAIGPVTDERHRSLTAQAAALGRDIIGETPALNAVVLADYLRCGPSWYLRESRPMLTYPIQRRVSLLQAPLLIIRGGNDPIAGLRWCRTVREAASRGRLAIVPGHRHVVQFTAPRAVASAIRSFLSASAALDD